jgi:AcrR family transcriptional regulator
MTSPKKPRRSPSQARSQHTVACVLEGAARVFRREGFAATTNRIAAEAGVSIGSLYEYFPNKQALLIALAERHVSEAERGVAAAISSGARTPELLRALQAAILASHCYPSQAIDHIARSEHAAPLRERIRQLRERVLSVLGERAGGHADAQLRARAAFGLIAELTSLTAYESEPAQHAALAEHLLHLASAQLDL